MDASTRDYMQGHVFATEGEVYGEYKPCVRARVMVKFVALEIK